MGVLHAMKTPMTVARVHLILAALFWAGACVWFLAINRYKSPVASVVFASLITVPVFAIGQALLMALSASRWRWPLLIATIGYASYLSWAIATILTGKSDAQAPIGIAVAVAYAAPVFILLWAITAVAAARARRNAPGRVHAAGS